MKTHLMLGLALVAAALSPSSVHAAPRLRVGAAVVDITPTHWPVPIGSGFGKRFTSKVHDPLSARAIVFDDGTTSLAVVIVDSTLVSREIYDAAKLTAAQRTGIPAGHMLMAATHTHSAPAAMELALVSPDEHYPALLKQKLAQAVVDAHANLQPAQIGWGTAQEADEVFCRRWKMKPGAIPADPFGRTTDRVKMNPGYRPESLVEPSGPVDPQVSVIAARTTDGRPLAVWTTYSLHYVGGVPGDMLSADYYGEFAAQLTRKLGGGPGFVGMLANGASGDINNVNYAAPPRPRGEPLERLRAVAGKIADHTAAAYRSMRFRDDVTLAVVQRELTLGHRLPSGEDIAQARQTLEALGDRIVGNVPGVYARETLLMGDPAFPKSATLKLQAIRIGDVGIVTIPGEPFARIGLNVRAASALTPTFTVGLANGYHGYIPTPADHALGGYETWRCRWSCLEVDASVKIERQLVEMLGELK